MTPLRIAGFTRNLGAPENWEDDGNGPCISLPIRDHVEEGVRWMISRYEPSAEDIQNLIAGRPLELWINGVNHPAIRLLVPPE